MPINRRPRLRRLRPNQRIAEARTPPAGGTTPAPGGTTPPPGGTTPPPSGGAPTPGPTSTPTAKPKLAAAQSSKTKKITFVFAYDSHELMTGRWTVSLMGGGDQPRTQSLLIDDLTGASGTDIGNRMEMVIPSSFAASDDVTVLISSTIVQLPKTISATLNNYLINGWNEPRNATAVITRAKFDATQTYTVLQATTPVGFKLSTAKSDTSSSTTVSSRTGGIEVGVENAAEAGANIGLGEGVGATVKDTVKVTAKGMLSATSSEQAQNTTTDGVVVEVTGFRGRRVDDTAPAIVPVN